MIKNKNRFWVVHKRFVWVFRRLMIGAITGDQFFHKLSEAVQVEVHWQGGHITQTLVKRPVGRLEQMSDYQALMDRVKMLQSQSVRHLKWQRY